MLRRAWNAALPALILAGTTLPARADLVGFDPATTARNQDNSDGSPGLPIIGAGGATLTLTDGQEKEARSAFSTATQSISAFQVRFDYHATGYDPAVGGADGVAFVLQTDPRGSGAVGGAGFGLGYGDGDNGSAITPSVAFELNLLRAGGRYSDGTALVAFGATGSYASTGDFAVDSGDPLRVTLTYDGLTFTETLLDLATSQTFTTGIQANLPSLLGSSTAFVGFTGGTGAMTSIQTISDFSYSATLPPLTAVPEPASLALLAIAIPVALLLLRRRCAA